MNKRFVIAAVALVAMSAVHAQEAPLQSYEVELVIFRVNRPTGTPENWALAEHALSTTASSNPAEGESAPQRTPAGDSTEAPPLATTFPALTPAQYRLTSVEDSLRRSKNYQLLAHFGWTQPGYPRESTPKFSIQPYLQSFLPDGIHLTGQASLARGPLRLFLMLDLVYQAPDGQRFFLREERRMQRSREKHYFDHPYFGVVALVTPKEK